jgi:pathogenesis-related protein 1
MPFVPPIPQKVRTEVFNLQQANNIYGENIRSFYLIPKTTTPNFSAQAITGIDWWHSEVSVYNVNNPGPAYHFTQLVWKSSKKIGCSWSAKQCTDSLGTYYLYCEFSPKGNIEGEYEANVTP